MVLAIICLSFLLSGVLPAMGQDGGGGDKIDVIVSQHSLVSVVKAIGAGDIRIVDPIPRGDAANDIELVILTDSSASEVEGELKGQFPNAVVLDREDYAGIEIKDFSEFESSSENYWLSYRNTEKIAIVVANTIAELGVDQRTVMERLEAFRFELNALEDAGVEYFTGIGRERSRWVVLTPDVYYVVDNLGVVVGTTIMNPDGTFKSGPEVAQIEYSVMQEDHAGIVCAVELKDEEAGQIAITMSERSDTPVCWVKTETGPDDTFVSLSAYNLGAMTAAISHVRPDRLAQGESTAFGNIIWGVVVAGLLIWVFMLNKKTYYLSSMPQPVFDKDRKKKKKK